MTTASGDAIVDRYLDQLEKELRTVPASRRREVVEEISGHIAQARDAVGVETDADVLNILDRVGDPVEIAADARERFGVQERQRSSWREVAALILLPFGGLIVPVAGWFIGVFFLWISDAWTVRDKLIGTLVLPGGLLLPFTLFVVVGSGSGQMCSSVDGGPMRCTGGGSSVAPIILLVVLLAAPLCAALYLGLRLRRR